MGESVPEKGEKDRREVIICDLKKIFDWVVLNDGTALEINMDTEELGGRD